MTLPENPIVDQHLINLEAAFRGDDRVRAHAIVDQCFEQLAQEAASESVTKLTSLSKILTPRHADQLESCGIRTVGQLINYNRTQLCEGPRLQGRSITIIEDILARHGFAIRRVTAGDH